MYSHVFHLKFDKKNELIRLMRVSSKMVDEEELMGNSEVEP